MGEKNGPNCMDELVNISLEDRRILLHTSTALCPECLKEFPCEVYALGVDRGEYSERDKQTATLAGSSVYMQRTCPKHGTTTTRIWNDAAHYEWLRLHAHPKVKPPAPNFPVRDECPFGCGTCSRHERMGTLLEIEVTRNCNLHCPVCFMSADTGDCDPTLEEIGAMYDTIAKAVGTDGAVQLTGGEPTCRRDLADIVRMGRNRGFWGIELNTNGLVVAGRVGYLESLVEAGLTGVYLSFDGVTGNVYETTCGRDILDVKLRAIERCRECNIQVVLSVAVVAGLNDEQLGDILQFAMDNSDVVAGIALQPAFTSGRYEVGEGGEDMGGENHRADIKDACATVDAQNKCSGNCEPTEMPIPLANDREFRGSTNPNHAPLTGGDVIFKLAQQSNGLLTPYDIWPLGTSHPLCDSGVFLLRDIEEKHESGFWPASKMMTMQEYEEGFNPHSPQGSVFLDILHKRGVPYSDGLSIIVMNYMDVYTMDTQRLRECSMMVTTPTGLPLPFCSYHLTDKCGRRIYPTWLKHELADDLSPLSKFEPQAGE